VPPESRVVAVPPERDSQRLAERVGEEIAEQRDGALRDEMQLFLGQSRV
jgi:hypothetical protein